jgi:hypothetical protein
VPFKHQGLGFSMLERVCVDMYRPLQPVFVWLPELAFRQRQNSIVKFVEGVGRVKTDFSSTLRQSRPSYFFDVFKLLRNIRTLHHHRLRLRLMYCRDVEASVTELVGPPHKAALAWTIDEELASLLFTPLHSKREG